MYTPGQFAKRVGVSVKTIQKWDRSGILPAKRTITNRRYYTDEELAAALRLPHQHKPRVTIAYCRVSSQAQKADLQNQQAVLKSSAEPQPSMWMSGCSKLGEDSILSANSFSSW
jgi:putative resolvase